MDRRRFLRRVGVGSTVALAGCLGGDSDSADGTAEQDGDGGSTDTSGMADDAGTAQDSDGTQSGGDGAAAGGSGTTASGTVASGSDGTPTSTGTPLPGDLGSHPAAAGLRDQPRKGDLDGHVVLAFEDPSCIRCRAFEQNTAPKIEKNLVEPGKAAFVVRTYPVVYPWGKPATQALEATFARSEDAFWKLLDHYFDTQSEYSKDNVLDRTESFVDENTDLDGEQIRSDAESKAYDDAVQADLNAGENAEIGRTTPVVLLFRDGEYVTKASGSVSYDLIKTALKE